jgi:hypothetical protein
MLGHSTTNARRQTRQQVRPFSPRTLKFPGLVNRWARRLYYSELLRLVLTGVLLAAGGYLFLILVSVL